MNIENLSTINNLDNFIQGNQAVAFTISSDKHEQYPFIQKSLVKFCYITPPKNGKCTAK